MQVSLFQRSSMLCIKTYSTWIRVWSVESPCGMRNFFLPNLITELSLHTGLTWGTGDIIAWYELRAFSSRAFCSRTTFFRFVMAKPDPLTLSVAAKHVAVRPLSPLPPCAGLWNRRSHSVKQKTPKQLNVLDMRKFHTNRHTPRAHPSSKKQKIQNIFLMLLCQYHAVWPILFGTCKLFVIVLIIKKIEFYII